MAYKYLAKRGNYIDLQDVIGRENRAKVETAEVICKIKAFSFVVNTLNFDTSVN